ncbi:MAG TPA: EAL domain-containing protein [Gammaproteobacteria bacterium]|nr:EAL domain-containing protein [Gammaproteobacteria bacterium]
MKLCSKIMTGVSLIWTCCLLLIWVAIELSHYFLPLLIALIVLSTLLTFWCIHFLIVKNFKKLSAELSEALAKNDFTQRLTETGPDEFVFLSKQFNKMLDILEAFHKKSITRSDEQIKKLQQSNIELKREIEEHKLIKNELISHKEHLIKLAHYDNLTSLPNRVFFNEMLNKTLKHASRHKNMMGILFIDIDRFKNINDALGYPKGDWVLQEIANRFSTVLRASDILARLGGDEFIILLNDIGHTKFASPVAEKLLQICSEPIKIEHHEFSLTASIGISIYPNDGISLEDLQRNADIAMYNSKHAGGGVFQYFTKKMNIEAHEHIKMEAALRRAISNNEFVLYYQPKLNLKDGSIESVEALIRWESSELGLVNPSQFIPLAEETGLIMQIGEWALREACRANKAWQTEGYQPICVAVNLSPKQFYHQDIAQLVVSVLDETGLDAKYLELEITETAVMDNVESTIKKLNDIKERGVRISVDDFGTGYTSINYLKKFPVNILKIDQSFIKNIPSNQNNTAITSAVIALAHILGMKVVAEGVETAEQLLYLADNNCDIVQGYYLSRPLPEQKIVLQFQKAEHLEILPFSP